MEGGLLNYLTAPGNIGFCYRYVGVFVGGQHLAGLIHMLRLISLGGGRIFSLQRSGVDGVLEALLAGVRGCWLVAIGIFIKISRARGARHFTKVVMRVGGLPGGRVQG